MFADPTQIVKQFGLCEGMRVADFGAGSGAYSFPMADIVSGNGMVYAIEVQKDLLVRIKNDATSRHVKNLMPIWADIEKVGGTKLADRSLDGVLLSNVLFQVKEKDQCLKEIYRILKSGGRVFFIDWSDSFSGMGPHTSDVISEKIARELFEANKFTYGNALSVGSHHYGMIFNKI